MAVRYEWNLAQYVVHLRGLETNVTSLKVWKGKVAIQQATLFDENGSIFHDDHWILPGGGTRYWIPQGTFPYINNTNCCDYSYFALGTASKNQFLILQ
jgi:hypothetical protein